MILNQQHRCACKRKDFIQEKIREKGLQRCKRRPWRVLFITCCSRSWGLSGKKINPPGWEWLPITALFLLECAHLQTIPRRAPGLERQTTSVTHSNRPFCQSTFISIIRTCDWEIQPRGSITSTCRERWFLQQKTTWLNVRTLRFCLWGLAMLLLL